MRMSFLVPRATLMFVPGSGRRGRAARAMRCMLLLNCCLLAGLAAAADGTTPAVRAAAATSAVVVAGDCPAAAAPADEVLQARRLLADGRRAAALLPLQRRLAEEPQDCAARSAMLALLKELGGDAAAHELPAGATLGGRPWLSRTLAPMRTAAWLTFEAGQDSNINSATRLDGIELPVLNYRSLALNPVLVQRSSGFAGIDAGLVATRPLAPTASMSAIIQAAARYNTDEPSFLPHGYFAALTAERWWARTRLAGEVIYLQRRLGRFRVIDRWQQGASLGLEPVAGWRLMLHLSLAGSRYPLFNAVDTEEQASGVQLAHARSGMRLAVQSGRERSRGPQKDLDRDFDRFTLDWSRKLGNGDVAAIYLASGRSRYLEPSPLFLAQRLDKTRELVLWYRHRLDADWSLTPKLQLEENASTIPVVAFRRHQVLLELRREW